MKTIMMCRQQQSLPRVLALAGLSALAVLAGCDQQQDAADKAEQQVERAADTAERKIDQAKDQAQQEIDAAKDAAITARVKSALLTDPLLKGASIEVSTVNGVVTLQGTVNEEPDIARAIEVANTPLDVKGVQSELVVQQVK